MLLGLLTEFLGNNQHPDYFREASFRDWSSKLMMGSGSLLNGLPLICDLPHKRCLQSAVRLIILC
jgi:hypothetical protein